MTAKSKVQSIEPNIADMANSWLKSYELDYKLEQESLNTEIDQALNTAKKANCVKINIGIVEENKKLKNWYEQFGFTHTGTKKYDFFPFTCGYMEKNL